MTDIEFLLDLVTRAGRLALTERQALSREFKSDHSLVTNADRAVEELVRSAVAERFPGDAFYGEESGGDPLAADRVWITDPIDGTINFATGLPVWGVSVGLAVDMRPALGAFHLPETRETFWFEAGVGAFRNGERLRVEDRGPLHSEEPVGIGTEAIHAVDLSQFPCRPRNFGSLAAHWCYTASGALLANVSVLDKLHDLGAAFGVAVEAGCAVEYLEGGAMEFSALMRETTNQRPLLVGPRDTLARIRACLRERPSGIEDLYE